MRNVSRRQILRFLAVSSWIVAALWLLADPGYEPLIAFITGLGAPLASLRVDNGQLPRSWPPWTKNQSARYRATMLNTVKYIWIDGVLEQSLQGAPLLDLRFHRVPDQVRLPGARHLAQPFPTEAVEHPDDPLVDTFHASGRALLVLGEAGAGKTTMLLSLARDAVTRASKDAAEPIPVVLHLATWARDQAAIAEWVAHQVAAMYHVPRKVAHEWVRSDDLLLLLDGLDELDSAARRACVAAINAYRDQHFAAIVVCSRSAEYAAVGSRLRLGEAVVLQPLTSVDVRGYLRDAGEAAQPLLKILSQAPALGDVIRSPLMLSIASISYQ